MSLSPRGTYCFGEFQLNLDLRVLVREGQRVPLGTKAYEVLSCLVSRAGTAVSKNDLLKEVWADSYVEEGTLVQHVFSLRKALGDKAACIVTVPGHGYMFEGEVRHSLPEARNEWPFAREGVLHEVRERTHVVVQEPMLREPAATAGWSMARLGGLALCVLLVAGGLAGWVWSRRAAPRDHVGLVLADFDNTTGDNAFDRTLKRALEIDLAQSPYLNVLDEREGVETLGRMQLKPDSAITPSVAREICVRTNRLVALSGTISNIGQEYLLTLEAIDCNSGKRLAAVKAEAADKGRVLRVLDSLAEGMRSKLGESAKSVHGFEVPIEQMATSSLEALKLYSIGSNLMNQGKPEAETLPFFQKAVEIDPKFAWAYLAISNRYYNMGEPHLADENLRKAYELSGNLNPKEKLEIQADYDAWILGDMVKGVGTYRLWTAMYPQDWVPWVDMANLYQQLDRYDEAIAAGRRAVELRPNTITYIVLARAYRYANRFSEAKLLGQEAVQQRKDQIGLHAILLEIASDERDAAAFAHEDQVLASTPDSLRDYYRGEVAIRAGEFAQAEALFQSEIASERRDGLAEEADQVATEEAAMEREAGRPDLARATLGRLGAPAQATVAMAVERAMLGDAAAGERFLEAHRKDAQLSTDLEYLQIPRVKAALAVAKGKPAEAVALLSASNPYGLGNIPMLRQLGDAAFQAGQWQTAVQQYKKIVENEGASFDIEYPLARLGLARAYAAAGDIADSRSAYAAFFEEWKDADADLPVLKAARAEFARLG